MLHRRSVSVSVKHGIALKEYVEFGPEHERPSTEHASRREYRRCWLKAPFCKEIRNGEPASDEEIMALSEDLEGRDP